MSVRLHKTSWQDAVVRDSRQDPRCWGFCTRPRQDVSMSQDCLETETPRPRPHLWHALPYITGIILCMCSWSTERANVLYSMFLYSMSARVNLFMTRLQEWPDVSRQWYCDCVYVKLEIRSVERGICPIAMLYSLAAAYKGGKCKQGAIIFHGAEL